MRILHILRAPVGGLFRHVRDLAKEQASAGHQVGVIADARSNDSLSQSRLADLACDLSLGLHRVSMSRNPSPRDLLAIKHIRSLIKHLELDIVHGHGAKGGLYARIATDWLRAPDGAGPVSIYTPHGGSLHFNPNSSKGFIFAEAERWLAGMTDGLIFESAYSSDVFDRLVGGKPRHRAIIPNGLLPTEFDPIETAPDAADFLFIGELRHLKGIDLLLEALATLNAHRKQPVTAIIVGEGPDEEALKKRAYELGLEQSVKFQGALPAREAFAMGRVLVMPSRAESFPYIVLETAAAGMPMIASDVGGIPEIVAGTDTELVPGGDAARLAGAMRTCLDDDGAEARARAQRLREAIADKFTVTKMARQVEDLYARALTSACPSWSADAQPAPAD